MSKIYSCEQVAERYGVKVDTVWSWIRAKKLVAIKISSRNYRVTEDALNAFEKANASDKD